MKNYLNFVLAVLIFSIIPTINHAQVMSNFKASSTKDRANTPPYSANWNDDSSYSSNTYSINNYNTPEYNTNSRYYYSHVNGGYKRSDGYIHLGRSFDNSDNFSSGISSYQGTSTGPGPNGGYPGAPHGTYPTHYVDTSIYPNSYMQRLPP